MPVVLGADRPLSRNPVFADAIHGASGLGGVTLLPSVTPPEQHSTSLNERIKVIADSLLAEPPGTAWLIPTGPLTNIALLLQQHPAVATHVAGISFMGGAIGSKFTNAPLGRDPASFGNWSPVAEFNILVDPEAAHYVFAHPVFQQRGNITMVGLDLTHLVRGVGPVQEKLFPSSDLNLSMVRRMYREVMLFFASTYDKHFGISDGPPLHDPLAVYAVLEPGRFDDRGGERFHVRVVLEEPRLDEAHGVQDRTGQTIAEAKPKGEVGVRVPRGVDLDAFWEAIDQALARVEKLASV